MAGPVRPSVNNGLRRTNSRAAMGPPPSRQSVRQPQRTVSPASRMGSPTSTAGRKRKERDFDPSQSLLSDAGDSLATNIHVVVRCRGRNEREIRENGAVVVKTDGVRGNVVDLAIGSNGLNNKTYAFDRVFSPAADQSMVYDDVVTPMLGEMLSGFNCTIFAYGQTGTGKTYTMTGDMTDDLGTFSESAGIIPRALKALFTKLDFDNIESTVKCSFIELYNEELRDLLAAEDGAKLKIYDETNKRGHTTTMVQGMEESHINNAAEGVKLLEMGSFKRQVAATKCNDLSSRSHTIFTITVNLKRDTENGEEFVSAGKLNLVDLAGSENIQRSGAENKRATEAGSINRSLLTLGRVINALVENTPHIPYRESKLTRLLQDSLGGRTKTCLIATISPSKSNIEETISTLDYAFRAKNIRNKPQLNQRINKKTLLREFTSEIEKLKSELISSRLKNGVHLSNETYEQLTSENESHRILVDEQRAKIETMETNLRNKVQELFNISTNFSNLKKDSEATRLLLKDSTSLLEQTEIVLEATKLNLAEENRLRIAHQETEEKLSSIGSELVSTLDVTVSHVNGLHSKLRRRSDLQSLNRNNWEQSREQVVDITRRVDDRLAEFEGSQRGLFKDLDSRVAAFVHAEKSKLEEMLATLKASADDMDASTAAVSSESAKARDEMNTVLNEIKDLREAVKTRVGTGLDGLSVAAQRISAEVVKDLGEFHTALHKSYSSLGKDFKGIFEELLKHLLNQRSEADELRQRLSKASQQLVEANRAANEKLDLALAEEKAAAETDRNDLISQMTALVQAQGQVQEARISSRIANVKQGIESSVGTFESVRKDYDENMNVWVEKEKILVDEVLKSRNDLKEKLKRDWADAGARNGSLQSSTKSIYDETVRLVANQVSDIGTQLQTLDTFVVRATSQNDAHHLHRESAITSLGSRIQSSINGVTAELSSTSAQRLDSFSSNFAVSSAAAAETIEKLDDVARQPLAELREAVSRAELAEYQPTGETPQKQAYIYPTVLPRTFPQPSNTSSSPETGNDAAAAAQTNKMVYTDADAAMPDSSSSPMEENLTSTNNNNPSLRELDPNMAVVESLPPVVIVPLKEVAMFKRSYSGKPKGGFVGRENNKSVMGRRLRSSPPQ